MILGQSLVHPNTLPCASELWLFSCYGHLARPDQNERIFNRNMMQEERRIHYFSLDVLDDTNQRILAHRLHQPTVNHQLTYGTVDRQGRAVHQDLLRECTRRDIN
jgi:hypothetical protein